VSAEEGDHKTNPNLVPVSVAAEAMEAKLKGFDKVTTIPGSTYRDTSTVVIVPTRGLIHHRVVANWRGLMAPMNGKCCWLFAAGDEVGVAYTKTLQMVLNHPELSKWKYVLTIEDDNLPPPDGHLKLLESIEGWGSVAPFDVVGGIYFTKGEVSMPMAYGDPDEYAKTGVLDFRPRDVRDGLKNGHVMRVNGTAMGFTLYRMSLFREFPPPWFVSLQEWDPGKGAAGFTQDLYFAKKLCEAGKRSAIDLRVKVGHLDVQADEIY
jgi:hypothetical protein